jgi:hypothetical protein
MRSQREGTTIGVASHIGDDRQEHDVFAAPGPPVADGVYDAALANLLAHAVQRPGRLRRLRRTGWANLRSLLCRWRDEIDRFPPESWSM